MRNNVTIYTPLIICKHSSANRFLTANWDAILMWNANYHLKFVIKLRIFQSIFGSYFHQLLKNTTALPNAIDYFIFKVQMNNFVCTLIFFIVNHSKKLLWICNESYDTAISAIKDTIDAVFCLTFDKCQRLLETVQTKFELKITYWIVHRLNWNSTCFCIRSKTVWNKFFLFYEISTKSKTNFWTWL